MSPTRPLLSDAASITSKLSHTRHTYNHWTQSYIQSLDTASRAACTCTPALAAAGARDARDARRAAWRRGVLLKRRLRQKIFAALNKKGKTCYVVDCNVRWSAHENTKTWCGVRRGSSVCCRYAAAHTARNERLNRNGDSGRLAWGKHSMRSRDKCVGGSHCGEESVEREERRWTLTCTGWSVHKRDSVRGETHTNSLHLTGIQRCSVTQRQLHNQTKTTKYQAAVKRMQMKVMRT